MKYLIYGLNYYPEPTGIGKYTGEMAEWLVQNDAEVKAVVAPPYYPQWELDKRYSNKYAHEKINGVDVYRCPLYIPKNPSVIKRLIHLLSFTFSSWFCLIKLYQFKPDVVVNIIPTIFTVVPALLYCTATGAKLVIHVQDFEGDAMFGLTNKKTKFLFSLWKKAEVFLLKKADFVSTISNAMIDNAAKKGVSSGRLVLFPNWSEVDRFLDVTGVSEFKTRLGLPLDKKIVLYSGNIGRKQGLEIVLKIAWLERNNTDLVFVICGDGSTKSDLMAEADELGLDNVMFFSLQPYEMLPQLLAMADVHLIIQNPGVADAVLPSKLTNILAVGGNAVITSFSNTEMGRLILDIPEIAVMAKPHCETSLREAITQALNMNKPNYIAQRYAIDNLKKESVISSFHGFLKKECE